MSSEAFSEGQVLSMGTLEETYKSIGFASGVDESALMTQKQLKIFIEIQLSDEGIEFSCSKCLNEPQGSVNEVHKRCSSV